MQGRFIWLVLFSAVIVVTALYDAGNVHATSPEGFTSTTVARGTLNAIEVSNYFAPLKSDASRSLQETQESSDLYVQNNIWQPRKHRLALAPGPQPNHRHGGSGDRL